MTEEDRISYLNFCCGMMYGALTTLQADAQQRAHIADCLQVVVPLLNKIYEYQEKVGTN